MTAPYTLFAWPVSPYSAKVRAYLQFKGIRFEERAPSLPGLMLRIKRAVGRPVMPTIRCADGRWLQDSTLIIDTLEGIHGGAPVMPESPTQRLAVRLLEMHADEWFPAVILHTRWNFPDNVTFARREFARYGLPWLPLSIGERLTGKVAAQMGSYRRVLGVSPDTIPGIERFLKQTIACLETHLQSHPYLFGTRPSVADFAFFGQLWAHIYRDPASRFFFDDANGVVAWMQRLQFFEKAAQTASAPGHDQAAFLENDEVPETLTPLFETLFAEHMPFMERQNAAMAAHFEQTGHSTHVPRSVGKASFRIGGVDGERKTLTFSSWKLQRALDELQGDDGSESQRRWLTSVGGQTLSKRSVSRRLAMDGFKLRLATT